MDIDLEALDKEFQEANRLEKNPGFNEEMSIGYTPTPNDAVNHPAHYGGAENPYEVIKVIEAWQLDFHLGNAVKYIGRAGKKTADMLEDLKKAQFYLSRKIENIERAREAARTSPLVITDRPVFNEYDPSSTRRTR